MTLEEAIKHCEEVVETNERICTTELSVGLPDIYNHKDEAKKCADEHRQLAEWLKDYKRLLEQQPCGDAISRQALIDATVNKNSIWNSITNSKGENLEEIISQLPPVNPSAGIDCEDAISREPFMDSTICEGFSCNECSFNRKDKGGCILEERVMKLPSVTPQQKMGTWIRWYEQREYDCGTEYIPHCKCSECGKEYDSHSSQFIKYCNECGAKMLEVEE